MSFNDNVPIGEGDKRDTLTTLKNGVVAINTLGTTLLNLYTYMKGELLYRNAAAVANATLFIVQTGRQYTVTEIDVTNTSGASQTFTIYLVPSGGTANASNTLFAAQTIAANTSFQWKGAQVIQAGATIQGFASAVTVTFMIIGGRASA